jgi:riboflavin biosynthesis pyrimidine reductase
MSDLEPLALLSAEAGPGLGLPSELRRVYGGDLALPDRCVYANFVQTIDGVVAIPSVPDSNRLVSGGSEADRFVMGLLRAAADVVLIGSGTLRASARGRWRPDTVFPAAAEAYAKLRRELGLDPRPRVAIITASGSIPSDRAVLEDAPLVVTTNTGAARLAGTLPAGVEVVVLPGEAEVGVAAVVELLRGRGHRRILSEAGPHVFGSLVEAGLVDELFLTVSPLLAGRSDSGPLGLVEGVALLPGHEQHARLRSARARGSHLFLQYALS